MFKMEELSPGIILLIVVWIACSFATAVTKQNYIDDAIGITIVYGIYRYLRENGDI